MERLVEIKDATKELNLIRSLSNYKRPFEVVGSYRLIDDGKMPEATVIIKTDDQETHEASTGVGPVDALANVLKKSLTRVFPFIDNVKLVDYSAKVHDAKTGTAAKVEVSIVFSNGKELWRVSEISENINAASFMALLDGFEYAVHLYHLSPNLLR
ncbi:MAG: hypothetical protein N2513_04135 [Deltaproteobacteria bacterium]|nr:hypothetical protein [Deltaproteobacteria bacterium]